MSNFGNLTCDTDIFERCEIIYKQCQVQQKVLQHSMTSPIYLSASEATVRSDAAAAIEAALNTIVPKTPTEHGVRSCVCFCMINGRYYDYNTFLRAHNLQHVILLSNTFNIMGLLNLRGLARVTWDSSGSFKVTAASPEEYRVESDERSRRGPRGRGRGRGRGFTPRETSYTPRVRSDYKPSYDKIHTSGHPPALNELRLDPVECEDPTADPTLESNWGDTPFTD